MLFHPTRFFSHLFIFLSAIVLFVQSIVARDLYLQNSELLIRKLSCETTLKRLNNFSGILGGIGLGILIFHLFDLFLIFTKYKFFGHDWFLLFSGVILMAVFAYIASTSGKILERNQFTFNLAEHLDYVLYFSIGMGVGIFIAYLASTIIRELYIHNKGDYLIFSNIAFIIFLSMLTSIITGFVYYFYSNSRSVNKHYGIFSITMGVLFSFVSLFICFQLIVRLYQIKTEERLKEVNLI